MTAPITCPDRLTLRRLMDGRLSPSIEQELSSHLDPVSYTHLTLPTNREV